MALEGNREDIEKLRAFVSSVIRADRIKQSSLEKILSKEHFDGENDILNFIISTDGANLLGDNSPPNRGNLESLLRYRGIVDMIENWKLPVENGGNPHPPKDEATIVFERGLRMQYARLAVRSIGSKTFTHPALQALSEFTGTLKPKEPADITSKELLKKKEAVELAGEEIIEIEV